MHNLVSLLLRTKKVFIALKIIQFGGKNTKRNTLLLVVNVHVRNIIDWMFCCQQKHCMNKYFVSTSNMLRTQ